MLLVAKASLSKIRCEKNVTTEATFNTWFIDTKFSSFLRVEWGDLLPAICPEGRVCWGNWARKDGFSTFEWEILSFGQTATFFSSFIFSRTTSPAAAYRVSQASWYPEEGTDEGEETWEDTLDDPLELLLLPESRDPEDQLPLDQLVGESRPCKWNYIVRNLGMQAERHLCYV